MYDSAFLVFFIRLRVRANGERKDITSIRHNTCVQDLLYERLRQWHLRKHDERARKIALYHPR